MDSAVLFEMKFVDIAALIKKYSLFSFLFPFVYAFACYKKADRRQKESVIDANFDRTSVI